MLNNYISNQVSGTANSIAVTIMSACVAVSLYGGISQGTNYEANNKRISLMQQVYELNGYQPTFDQYRNIYTGNFEPINNKLEIAITQIYAALIDGHESLGSEIESILFKNLWNLYEA